MRLRFVALAAVILACGENQSANQNTDSGSGGGGSTVHALTVAVSGSGKVTSSPAGIDCGATCSSSFTAGTAVALTATPGSGWQLSAWGGACSGNQACSVTMNADTAVTATFTQAPPGTVALSVAVQGSGTVTTTPAGISCVGPNTCSARFSTGTMITLTATPAPGWRLSSWGGGCTGVEGLVCTGPLPHDQDVSATFTPITYTLTVMVSGSPSVPGGRVTSSPAGIDCPTTCSAQFLPNASITLTAEAYMGSRLLSWGGCATTAGNVCEVLMPTHDQVVTADFSVGWRTLTVVVSGVGIVVDALRGDNCGSNGPATTCSWGVIGSQYTLKAYPNILGPPPTPTWGLLAWGGGCTGVTTLTCGAPMPDHDSTVTATFTRLRKLTVISHAGAGTVTSTAAMTQYGGSSCSFPGPACSWEFPAGMSITLQAIPGAAGNVTWGGGCTGVTTLTCTAPMPDFDQVVDVTFP